MSDEEEEDWFEQAMREAEGDGEETEAVDAGESDAETADGGDDDDTERDLAPVTEEPDPFGGRQGEQADERPGGGEDAVGGDVEETNRSDGDGESDPFGGVADDSTGAESDPFGGSDPGFDDTDFGDPGGSGSQIAGGEEGFDGDGFGGGGSEESFDEAELNSDIDRIDVGIEGLDEMILGGVPERSLMVAIGAAGTGKTTFGLQFLTEALQQGGRGIYITLEESREAILSTAEEKGWEFRKWRDEGQLAIVTMDPIEMANSLSSIRSDISRLVEEFDADRVVLDSVSLLEMMYDNPADRRSEVFDFARSLKRAGVTTMLTSEADSDYSYTSRYGIIEYLVDAVFILQYVRPSNFRETRLAVEIQKIRDANHSRETKPYEITNDGISVYRQANIF